jgi:hypothetical protein
LSSVAQSCFSEAWQARAEESLLILRRLCGSAVFVLYYQKIFLAAIDGD